ncbi:hypothetical protein COO60DRAFT_1477182 [Scenedesmus sp. NREL 46B-D3]|nr:hypothetical protein COO60DRAFT_1477182 [Scenedesmus sp. NREL 46B-D3]
MGGWLTLFLLAVLPCYATVLLLCSCLGGATAMCSGFAAAVIATHSYNCSCVRLPQRLAVLLQLWMCTPAGQQSKWLHPSVARCVTNACCGAAMALMLPLEWVT